MYQVSLDWRGLFQIDLDSRILLLTGRSPLPGPYGFLHFSTTSLYLLQLCCAVGMLLSSLLLSFFLKQFHAGPATTAPLAPTRFHAGPPQRPTFNAPAGSNDLPLPFPLRHRAGRDLEFGTSPLHRSHRVALQCPRLVVALSEG